MGKLSNFISKNRLLTQVTGNCTTHFATFLPREESASQGKVQLCHLEGYCEPMSKWKLEFFSLVGKHLMRETKFRFDIGSERDL